MNPILIGIAGAPQAGRRTFAELFAREVQTHRRISVLDYTNESCSDALVTVHRLQPNCITLVKIETVTDMEMLRFDNTEAIMACIVAPLQLRYERHKLSTPETSYDSFVQKTAVLENDFAYIVRKKDMYIIFNNDSIEALASHVRDFVKTIVLPRLGKAGE